MTSQTSMLRHTTVSLGIPPPSPPKKNNNQKTPDYRDAILDHRLLMLSSHKQRYLGCNHTKSGFLCIVRDEKSLFLRLPIMPQRENCVLVFLNTFFHWRQIRNCRALQQKVAASDELQQGDTLFQGESIKKKWNPKDSLYSVPGGNLETIPGDTW